jgi:hypothetical protein
MLPEQKLREAIEATIDARIAEALKQYEQHAKGGAPGEFRLKSTHLNAVAQRLQSALRDIMRQS